MGDQLNKLHILTIVNFATIISGNILYLSIQKDIHKELLNEKKVKNIFNSELIYLKYMQVCTHMSMYMCQCVCLCVCCRVNYLQAYQYQNIFLPDMGQYELKKGKIYASFREEIRLDLGFGKKHRHWTGERKESISGTTGNVSQEGRTDSVGNGGR